MVGTEIKVSGRQFIATGKRGAVKLVAESQTGTFHIIGG